MPFFRSEAFYTKNAFQKGDEIQRDPYFFLLTRSQKHAARGAIPQLTFDLFFAGLWAMYFLQRSRQRMRIQELKLNLDVMLGMSWRAAVGGFIANCVAKRLFKNREQLNQARIAETEVKKVMMQIPNAKPQLPVHKKPYSYILL